MVTAFEVTAASAKHSKSMTELLGFNGLQRSDVLKVWRQSSLMKSPVVTEAAADGISLVKVVCDNSYAEQPVVPSIKDRFLQFLTGKQNPEEYRLISCSSSTVGFDHLVTSSTRDDESISEMVDDSVDDVALAGDTLLFTMREDQIIDTVTYAKRNLLVSSGPAVKRICSKCEFLSLIVGPACALVGSPVRNAASLLEEHYGLGLLAVRLESGAVVAAETGAEADVTKQAQRQTFSAGDRLLVLAEPGSASKLERSHFVSAISRGALKPPVWFYDIVPVLLFIAGVAWASVEDTAMVRVSVLMFVFMVLGGWVDVGEVHQVMDYNILILIASSLALGTALTNSGIANALGSAVVAAKMTPRGALCTLTCVVILLNEIVTNNASATLGIPVAIAMSKALGLKSVRPFAMAVLLGGSAAFACPIGYATHMMVIGPGNYKLKDFLKFGIAMDIIYIVGISVLLPVFFPLV